jgi:hypothetical protein
MPAERKEKEMAKMASLDAASREIPEDAEIVDAPATEPDNKGCVITDGYCQACGKFTN